MMFVYSQHSLDAIEYCHPDIQAILAEVIKFHDIRVIWGWRDAEQQNDFFANGFSQRQWPDSKHNYTVTINEMSVARSLAFDAAPYFNERPHIRWNDHDGFIYLAGRIMGIADMLGISLRNGNDWDLDNDLKDQTFNDRGHFELVKF